MDQGSQLFCCECFSHPPAAMAWYLFSNLRILFHPFESRCTVVNPVLPLYILFQNCETGFSVRIWWVWRAESNDYCYRGLTVVVSPSAHYSLVKSYPVSWPTILVYFDIYWRGRSPCAPSVCFVENPNHIRTRHLLQKQVDVTSWVLLGCNQNLFARQ